MTVEECGAAAGRHPSRCVEKFRGTTPPEGSAEVRVLERWLSRPAETRVSSTAGVSAASLEQSPVGEVPAPGSAVSAPRDRDSVEQLGDTKARRQTLHRPGCELAQREYRPERRARLDHLRQGFRKLVGTLWGLTQIVSETSFPKVCDLQDIKVARAGLEPARDGL